jgi:hypothetical protein
VYGSSLDAIRTLLRSRIPAVSTIYMDAVPAEFEQPSFFLEHVKSATTDLSRTLVQFEIQWRIVYFPKLKLPGYPDKFDMLAAADALRTALSREPYVTAPDGTVFLIMDISGGPREEELSMTVQLQAQYNRQQPIYDVMQDIHLKEE